MVILYRTVLKILNFGKCLTALNMTVIEFDISETEI